MKRIIDNLKFITRNPSFITQFIRNGSNVRNAMDEYRDRKENKHCAFCGTHKKIQIHHIVPVSHDDTLADRDDNFIALCNRCHFTLGHGNNYKSAMKNVKQLCDDRIIVLSKAPKEEDDI